MKEEIMPGKIKAFLAILVALQLTSFPAFIPETMGTALAQSDDPAALLTEARVNYLNSQYGVAIKQIKQALEGVWNNAPLSADNVVYVKEQPKAFGVFKPRESDVFNGADPILLYCEPIGYTVKKDGENYYVALASEFSVLDNKDAVISGPFQLPLTEEKTRFFNIQVPMFFTFNLKGAPSGRFKLQVTLSDKNSSKKVTFQKPFTIK
jgi:hypothetical protein